MMSLEFLEQKTESDDITSFTFEIRALPEPELRGQEICDKATGLLLAKYGENEKFAVEINILGANESRQTLIIEVRVKDEQIPPSTLADFISRNIVIEH